MSDSFLMDFIGCFSGISETLQSKKSTAIRYINIYRKLQFNILAAIGELERGLIRERSREGKEKAKAGGVKFGAKPKLTSEEVQMLLKDYESPGLIKPEIAELYGISTSSVNRLYYENNTQITMSA